MEKKKKSLTLSIIAMIICIVLLFFSVVSVVIAVNDIEAGDMPYFLGVGICSSNGSYEGVEKNAVVLAKKITESELAVKDVVVFYYPSAPTTAKLYLGTITELKEDGTLEVYLGNESVNQNIDAADVRGKAVYSIAHLGYLVEILEGRYGVLLSMATTILLLAIIVLLLGGMIGIRNENRVYAALTEAKEKNGQIEKEIRSQEKEQVKESAYDLLEKNQAVEEVKENAQQEESAYEAEVTVLPVQEESADVPEQIIDEVEEAEEQTEVEKGENTEELSIQQEEAEEVTLATEKQNVESEENILPEQATARQEETQIAEKEVPKELKNSYLKGSFGTDRVSMEITCSEQEAEVMKKLIDLTAKKRNRFGLFTSISNVDEYVLKVWCEWEDVPVISSIVTEVKKRTKKKD